MIVVYQNAFGRNYTFQLLEKDGVTPRPIQGLTLTLRCKNLADLTELVAVACVITDSTAGEFYFTLPITLTTLSDGLPKTWICQFEVSQSGVLLDPSDEFTITVRKSMAVAG